MKALAERGKSSETLGGSLGEAVTRVPFTQEDALTGTMSSEIPSRL